MLKSNQTKKIKMQNKSNPKPNQTNKKSIRKSNQTKKKSNLKTNQPPPTPGNDWNIIDSLYASDRVSSCDAHVGMCHKYIAYFLYVDVLLFIRK